MPAFATIVLAVALALAPAAVAQSQPFPARPIKLVIPQPSGGHSDVIGRILGPKLAEILQQPVVIDNRSGAGGTIGAELVARAPRDGYTLLLGGSNNLSIAATMTEARYDPVRDFAPIGGVAVVPYALAVRTGVPATTLGELLAYARAHPGRLNYGSSGVGSTSSLTVEWIKSATGVNIVRYKLWAFALASFTTGVAGGLLAAQLGQPTAFGFPTQDSLTLLAAALIGGIYSLWGAVIAGAFSQLAPFLFQAQWGIDPNFLLIIFGVGLLQVLLTAPRGIVVQMPKDIANLGKLGAHLFRKVTGGSRSPE